jgi:hypothetical protein
MVIAGFENKIPKAQNFPLAIFCNPSSKSHFKTQHPMHRQIDIQTTPKRREASRGKKSHERELQVEASRRNNTCCR